MFDRGVEKCGLLPFILTGSVQPHIPKIMVDWVQLPVDTLWFFLLCYGHLWTDNACDSMMRFYYIFSMVIDPVNQTITCMMNLLPIYCLSLISGSTPGSYKNCLLLCRNLLCALIVYTTFIADKDCPLPTTHHTVDFHVAHPHTDR